MGAVKAIATELELYWTQSADIDNYWWRKLPDGETVTLGCGDNLTPAWFWIDDEYMGEYPTLERALQVIGEFARAALECQKATWSA